MISHEELVKKMVNRDVNEIIVVLPMKLFHYLRK